jgi:hypothetical protein
VRLLDIHSTAAFLGTSRQSVNRLISDGKLEAICIRSGRRKKVLRVSDSSLKKFLNIPKSETLVIEPAVCAEKKSGKKKTPPAVELAIVDGAKPEGLKP